MPFAPNEHLKGKFYYPASHYSIPADDLCYHYRDGSFDCKCVKPSGHTGAHDYVYSPIIRDISHSAIEAHDEALAASERNIAAMGIPT